MLISELKNLKIIILGIGKEGLSTYNFLRRNFSDMKITIADQKEISELNQEMSLMIKKDSNLTYLGGGSYLDSLLDFDLIIKSPGINPRQNKIEKALEKGVRMTSATNLFFANKKGRVIAVTGSKGKSTTSTLIFKVMEAAGFEVDLIGNIGFCSLDFLEGDNEKKWYVSELSSYQLEDFSGRADIAVLVSFFPEHLDYHSNLQNYLEAKANIAKHSTKDDKIVVNARVAEYMVKAEKWLGKKHVFNDDEKSKIINESVYIDDQKVLSLSELKIKGIHNLENILAVLKVTEILGINLQTAIRAISDFEGLPHRLSEVGTFKNLRFIDDAISTTPESTLAAIDAFSEKIGAIILGGKDRGYDFKLLAKKIVERKIGAIVLFPESGSQIKRELENTENFDAAVLETRSMEEAVKFCYENAEENSIVLLSCASPSYGVFRNFEDKGEQFIEAVKKFS